MRKISEDELKVLENTCNIACKILNTKEKQLRSSIYNNFKKNLKFSRNYQIEKNFSYIYYDVSNFYNISNCSVEVINETNEISLMFGSTGLRFMKRYKLLINNKKIVYLTLLQELIRVYMCDAEENLKILLPIFICKQMTVYLAEDGIKTELLKENYSVYKMSYFTPIFKSLFVELNDLCYEDDKLEIYYEGKLVKVKENIDAKKEIAKYLNEQLTLGNIGIEDLKFDKKITYSRNTIKINSIVNIDIIDEDNKYCTIKDLNLCSNSKIATCKLTNNSKIKIIVKRYESCFNKKKLTLYNFIKKILEQNYFEIQMKPTLGAYITNEYSFYTKDEKILLKEERKPLDDGISFSVTKRNNIFLPKCPNFCGKTNFVKIISEFLKKEEETIYLIQYSYANNFSKKFIVKMVYEIEQVDFAYGITKIENIIFPNVIKEKCCVILLDEEFDINYINANEFCEVFKPWIRTSCREIEAAIIKQILDSEIYSAYTLNKECDIFKEEKDITFLKLDKLTFSQLTIVKQKSKQLTDEQVEFINSLIKEKLCI